MPKTKNKIGPLKLEKLQKSFIASEFDEVKGTCNSYKSPSFVRMSEQADVA